MHKDDADRGQARRARSCVSLSAVQRIWRKHRVRPQRLERHMVSNYPGFETKAAEMIGLYLSPPAHVMVLRVDEPRSSLRGTAGCGGAYTWTRANTRWSSVAARRAGSRLNRTPAGSAYETVTATSATARQAGRVSMCQLRIRWPAGQWTTAAAAPAAARPSTNCCAPTAASISRRDREDQYHHVGRVRDGRVQEVCDVRFENGAGAALKAQPSLRRIGTLPWRASANPRRGGSQAGHLKL